MHEVLVWGIGTSYDRFRRFLNESQVKINALISSYDEHIKSIDGIDVIKPEDIKNFNYEFIIVASSFFEEIVKTARGGGINREKLIDAKVFELNGFDFDRYVSIINKNISIVSDDCWGGVLYHSLGLEFKTPFINFGVDHDGYVELVNNLKYYLSMPLTIDNKIHSNYMIGNLKKMVNFYFNHDVSESEIIKKWNRRVERFNFENYLVKMTLNNDEDIERFKKISVKKVGFYHKKIYLENIIYLEDWYDIKIRYKNGWSFNKLAWSTVEKNSNFGRYYDVFKLLNGESDFMRNITYK